MHINCSLLKPGTFIKFNRKIPRTKFLNGTEGVVVFTRCSSYRIPNNYNIKFTSSKFTTTHNQANLIEIKVLVTRYGKKGMPRLEHNFVQIPFIDIYEDKPVIESILDKQLNRTNMLNKDIETTLQWLHARLAYLENIRNHFPEGLLNVKYKHLYDNWARIKKSKEFVEFIALYQNLSLNNYYQVYKDDPDIIKSFIKHILMPLETIALPYKAAYLQANILLFLTAYHTLKNQLINSEDTAIIMNNIKAIDISKSKQLTALRKMELDFINNVLLVGRMTIKQINPYIAKLISDMC